MRFIRTVLLLLVIIVAAVFAYNYWSGNGLTLHPAPGAPGIDADAARDKGREIAGKATDAAVKTAEGAGHAATKVDDAVREGTLTVKIKAKMALDDLVKARDI